MSHLSQQLLAQATATASVALPQPAHFQLPEKVLQFGTGVLLRGLPDYLIDKANRQGIFNGRIVVVKSTDGGDIDAFRRQDGLYTLSIRGIEAGREVEEIVVCSAISRVLSAKSQWDEIMACAANPELQVVISNTTEVGIQLTSDDICQSPPQSFPGKLLAFLLARYQAFEGAKDKGLVIVPTELIPDNGTKLEGILLELAHRNALEVDFIDWLESANQVCNSLVDRIVPGRPDAATQAALASQLGYQDDLLTMSEVYTLWAIEGDERVKQILSFEQADAGVIVQPDINLFRELKLRLLNGTHTLSCALAFLAGFPTVREAMEDENMAGFIQHLMLTDLLPGIPYAVDEAVGQRFGMQVLDRFRNPAIEHRWLSISMNYTMKMQMRNVATLLHYYKQQQAVPHYMALGFAAYLLFMRGTHQQGDVWYGEALGGQYPIQDEKAGYFAELWNRLEPAALVRTVLHNQNLWGHDLSALPGFADSVSRYLENMLEYGVHATLVRAMNRTVSV
ncbi:tagaturonate reductase [Microvirga sp. STR05]|uniref:Tagaturonate reductase n=1 Tax=Hymenobacter duratus TaxID=2771356 RepID=A0ABR8JED7_9BACT|nr:tagaturonate reductase [Hymenobacter duratus]MBD2715222.1 tagaturonate reductase [Hymenobacter duratus]MBR7950129.1 tagaturonate reductase [Microvirga sp. STR05]